MGMIVPLLGMIVPLMGMIVPLMGMGVPFDGHHCPFGRHVLDTNITKYGLLTLYSSITALTTTQLTVCKPWLGAQLLLMYAQVIHLAFAIR